MKKYLLVFVFISTSCAAQTLKKYTASNDITYEKGDKIIMGKGSGSNDQYLYLWITGGGEIKTQAYMDTEVSVKKIKNIKRGGVEKVMFLVGGGNIANYTLDIENAITYCEIKDCNKEDSPSSSNKYDDLVKLKKLLDDGIITQEEFNSEKKKLLGSN